MGSRGPGLPGGMAQPQEGGGHGSILIQATILSYLDYCISLLPGLPAHNHVTQQSILTTANVLYLSLLFWKLCNSFPLAFRVIAKAFAMFYEVLHDLAPQCLSDLIYCCFASLDTSIILLLQVYVISPFWNVLTDIHIMLLHGLYSNITSLVRSPWSFNLTSLLHHLLILLSCFIFPHCSHLHLNMFSCLLLYFFPHVCITNWLLPLSLKHAPGDLGLSFVHYYILKSQGQGLAHDKTLNTYLWNQ